MPTVVNRSRACMTNDRKKVSFVREEVQVYIYTTRHEVKTCLLHQFCALWAKQREVKRIDIKLELMEQLVTRTVTIHRGHCTHSVHTETHNSHWQSHRLRKSIPEIFVTSSISPYTYTAASLSMQQDSVLRGDVEICLCACMGKSKCGKHKSLSWKILPAHGKVTV